MRVVTRQQLVDGYLFSTRDVVIRLPYKVLTFYLDGTALVDYSHEVVCEY